MRKKIKIILIVLMFIFTLTSCDAHIILCESAMKVDNVRLRKDNSAIYTISYKGNDGCLYHYKFIDKPNKFQLGDTIKFEKINNKN